MLTAALLCRASNTTLRDYDHAVKRGSKRSAEARTRECDKAWEEVREKWHALQHLLHKRTTLDAARKGKGKASAGKRHRRCQLQMGFAFVVVNSNPI